MRHEILKLRLIALLSFSAVGIALISQYVFGMQPCAWCVFQRLLYILIGLIALISSLAKPEKTRIALGSVLIITVAISGMTSAWYQERVAANTFSCAQTAADQIMTKTGLESILPWLFGIYASCMDARVKMLGVEYAWWSLIVFALLAAIALSVLKTLTRNASYKKTST